MYKPCKYIHVLLQRVNVDAVIFTSYGKINKVYELPLTLKNDNDSNVSVQDYSQHPNNQQQQPLLLPPISNFFYGSWNEKRNCRIK